MNLQLEVSGRGNFNTRIDITTDGEGSFTIKNETSKEAVLEMSSGQQIEFQLLNKANESFTRIQQINYSCKK